MSQVSRHQSKASCEPMTPVLGHSKHQADCQWTGGGGKSRGIPSRGRELPLGKQLRPVYLPRGELSADWLPAWGQHLRALSPPVLLAGLCSV